MQACFPGRCGHRQDRRRLVWGFSFRAGTTAARKVPPNVEALRTVFQARLALAVRRDLPEGATMVVEGVRVPVEMIRAELVVNSDQGGISWVAFQNATWAPTGSKRVELQCLDDKRQMTAVLASNARGEALPLQIIMQGKSDKSLPSARACAAAEAEGFHYMVTDNHWSNLGTLKEYVGEVLVRGGPRLGLPCCRPIALVSCSLVTLRGSGSSSPASGRLQRCAVPQVRDALEKLELEGLTKEERQERIEDGAIKIDTSVTALKPLIADWHLATWQHLKKENALIKGWRQSRLLEALDPTHGHHLYELAKKKQEQTLWVGTKVVVEGGVGVPARLDTVRVVTKKKNDAGQEVDVVVEVDVHEPQESETDIADMDEVRARCAAAAEKVNLITSSFIFYFLFYFILFFYF